MNEHIEKAKKKAAQMVAQAELESRIMGMIPESVKAEPRVMMFRDVAHISFQPESFGAVSEILGAFDTVPGFDFKDGGFRCISPDDSKGEILGEYFAWVEMQASLRGGESAKFRAFAVLSDGTRAQISVDYEGGTYSAKYQNRPWHKDLSFRFINLEPRAVKYHEYKADGGLFLAQCASVVNFSTGSHIGDSVIRRGYFATARCLSDSLETLSNKES